MSYSFTRNSKGTFNVLLGDIIYNYSQLKQEATSANYLDITLVDEDNNVVIYKQLQDVQFYIELDQYLPIRIALKVETVTITFEMKSVNRDVLCRVETEKNGNHKIFYPTLITVFN